VVGELEASVRDGRKHHHRRFAVDDYGELDDDAEQSSLFHRAMVRSDSQRRAACVARDALR
jgi:hypothetical protein